jgi:hypothetical protein
MKMMGFAGLNPSYELEFYVIARSAATKQSTLFFLARQWIASLSLSSGRANARLIINSAYEARL